MKTTEELEAAELLNYLKDQKKKKKVDKIIVKTQEQKELEK